MLRWLEFSVRNLVFLPFLTVQTVQSQWLQRRESAGPGPLKSGELLVTGLARSGAAGWVVAAHGRGGAQGTVSGATDSGMGGASHPLVAAHPSTWGPGRVRGYWFMKVLCQ